MRLHIYCNAFKHLLDVLEIFKLHFFKEQNTIHGNTLKSEIFIVFLNECIGQNIKYPLNQIGYIIFQIFRIKKSNDILNHKILYICIL